MRLYMYQEHMYGNYYVVSEYIDDEELFCETCGDSDDLVFEFDTELLQGGNVPCYLFEDDIDTLYVYQDCEGDFYVTYRELLDEELYCDEWNDCHFHILTFKLSDVCAW